MKPCLVSWEGGNMRNAIPRECEVVITVPASEVEDVLAFVGECEQVWRDEFATIEDNISLYGRTCGLAEDDGAGRNP